MNISLTPELERSVRALVEEGRYGNQSEVLRAGLRLLLREEAKLAVLRVKLQEAFDAVDRGEVEPLDMEQIKDAVRAAKTKMAVHEKRSDRYGTSEAGSD